MQPPAESGGLRKECCPMNRAFRVEIVSRFDTQYEAACACGLAESRLSKIARGKLRPSDKELLKLERVFGTKVRTILRFDKPRASKNGAKISEIS